MLFYKGQTNTDLVTVKTYKFEYASNESKNPADYIELVFEKDSIVKGTYYGNEDNIHYVTDLKFDKYNQKDTLSFTLINYKYSYDESTPFHKVNYNNTEKLRYEIDNGVNFSGIISEKKLSLDRVFWYYHSRFDRMTFNIVKAE